MNAAKQTPTKDIRSYMYKKNMRNSSTKACYGEAIDIRQITTALLRNSQEHKTTNRTWSQKFGARRHKKRL